MHLHSAGMPTAVPLHSAFSCIVDTPHMVVLLSSAASVGQGQFNQCCNGFGVGNAGHGADLLSEQALQSL
jgi:hypothetical protein